MSADELQELQEHAEDAHHNPGMAPVSLTMAVFAVLVAVASLLGHRAHTEEVVLQAKASDQWAYYQAKNIRGHEDELFVAANSGAVGVKRNDTSTRKTRFKTKPENWKVKLRPKENVPIAMTWPRFSWRSGW